MVDTVYVTEGLFDALLDLAERRDPATVSAAIAISKAGALVSPSNAVADLDPSTPVFTDFYLPSEGPGRAVDAVFGVEMTVPHRQSQGRFISHPRGELSVSTRDHLHEIVLVAVPPWSRDDAAVFDRSGRRLELRILDAAPPELGFDL